MTTLRVALVGAALLSLEAPLGAAGEVHIFVSDDRNPACVPAAEVEETQYRLTAAELTPILERYLTQPAIPNLCVGNWAVVRKLLQQRDKPAAQVGKAIGWLQLVGWVSLVYRVEEAFGGRDQGQALVERHELRAFEHSTSRVDFSARGHCPRRRHQRDSDHDGEEIGGERVDM
jgi:hypothetical protein